MVRIIVVCGAGASSTFVAHRIRRAAAARGIEVRATATSESQLDAALADADVPIAILTEGAASASDGEDALDVALEFAGATS